MTAAHEGVAEMVVLLEYDNGGISEVALDRYAVNALMKNTNAETVEDLLGTSWEEVRNALTESYNRF